MTALRSRTVRGNGVADTATELTPYGSVTHALKTAYAQHDHALCSRPGYLRQLAPARGSNPLDMSARDWVAQHQVVISRVHALKPAYALAIEAQYCPAYPLELLRLKVDAMEFLVQHLRQASERFDAVPREYIEGCVQRWAGVDDKLSILEWADRLGMSRQALEHIRYGRRQRGQRGVLGTLDDLLAAAVAELREVLRRGGIVPQ